MNLIENLLSLIPGHQVSITKTLPTFSLPNVPTDIAKFREDKPLTANFSLYELTKTNAVEYQATNRTLTNEQAFKLTKVAQLGELIREVVGKPINVHSGYRCEAVNGKTAGSSKTSQHILCEAIDWTPIGVTSLQELSVFFKSVWEAGKQQRLKWGQLIIEQAKRDYGVTTWIHTSLGYPYRDKSKCGQVLCSKNGVYTLIGTVQ